MISPSVRQNALFWPGTYLGLHCGLYWCLKGEAGPSRLQENTESEVQLPERMRSLAQTGSDNNLCFSFWEFKVLEESLNRGLGYLTLSVPGQKRWWQWGQKGCWSPGEAGAGQLLTFKVLWALSVSSLKKRSCFKNLHKRHHFFFFFNFIIIFLILFYF